MTDIINMTTMFNDDELLRTTALLLKQDQILYSRIPQINLAAYYTMLDVFFVEHMDDFRGWVLKALLQRAEQRMEDAERSWKIACELCKNLLATIVF